MYNYTLNIKTNELSNDNSLVLRLLFFLIYNNIIYDRL
jgi:hypothetical protein